MMGEFGKMRIMGIDPGIRVTGYGLIETAKGQPIFVAGGVICSDSKATFEDKLCNIFERIVSLLDEYNPEAVVVEDLYSHYSYPKTAILMGHVRGVIYLAAAQKGIPIAAYTASRVKQALAGRGSASKEQIQKAIQRFLNLNTPLECADVADALALAVGHYHMSRSVIYKHGYEKSRGS